MLKREKFIIILLTCMFIVTACWGGWDFFKADERPNFLIIVTDDQRYDTMEYMPQTQALIFDQGVTFDNGYITTPICCPSRSSIFTGMYARNHTVHENGDELTQKTFIQYLKESGYTTALVGKYLNSWNGDARPEFDYWVSYQYGETRYYNPRLNINGEWLRHQGEYVTYSLGNYAIDFLTSAAKKRSPFVLVLAFNAPHDPNTPATEDEALPLKLPQRLPSFNEKDVSDKPAWLDNKEDLLTKQAIKEIDAFRRGQILTMYSLDRTIENVLSALEGTGELDKTMIIFLSDNGRHWGEHRLIAKNTIYEESIHVPFAIRYPPLIPQPYIENRIVANIDIAPTLYELAGISIPSNVDGSSLVNLWKQPQVNWREGLLIEGWPPRGQFTGIRAEHYMYAETTGDFYAPSEEPELELYDLEKDPYEMNNIVNDPEYSEILERLKILLQIEENRANRSP